MQQAGLYANEDTTFVVTVCCVPSPLVGRMDTCYTNALTTFVAVQLTIHKLVAGAYKLPASSKPNAPSGASSREALGWNDDALDEKVLATCF